MIVTREMRTGDDREHRMTSTRLANGWYRHEIRFVD